MDETEEGNLVFGSILYIVIYVVVPGEVFLVRSGILTLLAGIMGVLLNVRGDWKWSCL